MRSERLALGTAQFGLRYGVANRTGQVGSAEAKAIVERARACGMDTLDTAIAYGASEATLGTIGVAGWIIVSKLPGLPTDCVDVDRWIEAAVRGSLARLKMPRLGAVLLHEPMQLLGPQGHEIYAALRRLKEEGLTERIGLSVYGPRELDALVNVFAFDLVQVPFNILDRRLATTGWLTRLREAGIGVHVRSLFLQGVLLMGREERPPAFARWQPLWDAWHRWLEETRLTALEACVAFVASHASIDRAIVGVDGLAQLEEILAVASLPVPEPPRELCSEDLDLLEPWRWRLGGSA